jgi:dethiobiotin synthetase
VATIGNMRGLFITATDTGAGKTVIASAIARLWRREGRSFRVCKPVATGAAWRDGRLVADDTHTLARSAGETDLEAITPHVFAEPAAPPVAARRAGVVLTLEALVGAVRWRQKGADAVLVEGVGGLLCPVTERESVADLVAELDMPLVVVARRSLGTLNHTLLTLEAARQRRLRVVGVVVSETTPVAGVAEETNVEELRKRIDVPILAVVPYLAEVDAEIEAISAVGWWSMIA